MICSAKYAPSEPYVATVLLLKVGPFKGEFITMKCIKLMVLITTPSRIGDLKVCAYKVQLVRMFPNIKRNDACVPNDSII